MKRCSGSGNCGKIKDFSYFYCNKNKYSSLCKECYNKKSNERHFKKREENSKLPKPIDKRLKNDPNIVGQKNNFLTVIERLKKSNGKEKNLRWFVRCHCECGNETIIRENFFTNGKTKSCGCYGSRNSVYRINQKPEGDSALHSYFSSYKNAAAKRKLEFLLTKEQFIEITKQNCYYCGSVPRYLHFNKRANGEVYVNGIDRIENNKGYLIDNCVSCCKNCNIAKARLTQEQFFELVINIYNSRNLGFK